jgi:hypothetical protein
MRGYTRRTNILKTNGNVSELIREHHLANRPRVHITSHTADLAIPTIDWIDGSTALVELPSSTTFVQNLATLAIIFIARRMRYQ